MFRRKDELDTDLTMQDIQGSLLAAESETVNVLSPQKAAQYKNESGIAAATASANEDVAAPRPAGASFSSPSSFGQTARPIQPAEAPRSSGYAPVSSHSNQNAASGFGSTGYAAPSAPASLTSATAAASSPASGSSSAAASPLRPAPLAPATPAEMPRFRQPEASRPAATASFNPNSEPSTMLNTKHNQNERVLTVGNDILLKGEITTCDRLVIQGKVDAVVSEVHTMELAEAGTFKGNAEVEYAEISGVFEGNLIVRTSLVIHKTGKVSGNITYGEIEIARGGTITGEIKTIGAEQAVSRAPRKKEEKVAA